MSKAKFEAARELIKEKKYGEARAILRTIDRPEAQDWLAKIDKLDPPLPDFPVATASAVIDPGFGQVAPLSQYAYAPYEENDGMRMQRIFRVIWGILTLLALGWMCYGLFVSSSAYAEVAGRSTNNAQQAGAALGASMGVGAFLCTGAPFLVLFAVLYWRNGVALREVKQHNEMLDAVARKR